MAALILIAGACFVVALLIFSGNKNALGSGGTLGRGLILQADSTSSPQTVNGQRFERRTILLDVELPGEPPYEISIDALIPRMIEALPGSALDVRVDPKNRGNVTIVGPVGSSAWLPASLAAMPMAAGLPRASSNNVGCGILMVGIGLLAAGAAVAKGFADEHAKKSEGKSESEDACAAAARCCKIAGGSKCSSYASKSQSTCESALGSFKKAASKLRKKCE